MATIRFVSADETEYVLVRDFNRNQHAVLQSSGTVDQEHGRLSGVSEHEQLTQEVRMYLPGGPDELQLFEVRVAPNGRGAPHAHIEDEIMFVLDGELEFGRRTYGAGSAVSIPGGTLYSFRAGPQGARFLNFRPRADLTYISKEEFMSERKARGASNDFDEVG
jgi:quercetin dioxygenase-like cupin family protein